jgi:PGF-pre-PGF domain-containing protein
MTLAADPASPTVAENGNFTLTISIQNPQADAVTTSYSLSVPAGLDRLSGDPLSSSGTSISGLSTKTLTFLIKHTPCFTGTKTLVFNLGDTTSAATVIVSGNASCTTTTASSGSSTTTDSTAGGGGAVNINAAATYAAGKATIKIPIILTGATETVSLNPAETDVRKFQITVKGVARNIDITIQNSKLPLNTAAAPGAVFHYLSITKNNLSDENTASGTIEFRVPKSWITNASINADTVSLYRLAGTWTKLSTTKLSDDSSFHYYSAATPGFSLFAISGELTQAAAQEQAAQAAPEAAQEPAEQNQTLNETAASWPQFSFDATLAAAAVILIGIAGGLGFAYRRYRLSKR